MLGRKTKWKKKIGRKPAIEWSNINHIMKFTYIQCKQLILCTVFVLPYALKCVSIFFYKQTSWLNLVFKWNAEFHCREFVLLLDCFIMFELEFFCALRFSPFANSIYHAIWGEAVKNDLYCLHVSLCMFS